MISQIAFCSFLGKPYVDNFPKFAFNVSHNGSYTCILASNSSDECGVDVMKCCFKLVPMSLIDTLTRKLSKSEKCYLENANSIKLKHQRFLRLWCLKESYLKAIGSGISEIYLEKISFSCLTELSYSKVVVDSILSIDGVLQPFVFTEILYDGHIFALCTKKSICYEMKNSLKVIEPSLLLASLPDPPPNDLYESFWQEFSSKV